MNKEQVAYVVRELRKGVERDTLKENLLTHEYTEDQITQLFSDADSQILGNPTSSSYTNDVADESKSTTSKAVLPGVGGLIGGSLSFVFRRLDILGCALFVQIFILIPIIANTLFSMYGIGFFLGQEDPTGFMQYAFLLPLIISTVLVVFLSTLNLGALLFSVTAEEHTSYWQGLSWVWKHFWSFLWVSILSSSVIITGYIFLLIPGLIVLIYLFFTQIVLARENVRGINALLRSTQLVRGNWWGVFGRVVLMFIFVTIFGFIINLFIALLMSAWAGMTKVDFTEFTVEMLVILILQLLLQVFAMIFMIHFLGKIYHSLKNQKPAFNAEAKKSPRTLYIVMVWFMFLIPLTIIGISSVIMFSLSDSRERVTESVMEMDLLSFSMRAELYYDNNGSFLGFCDYIEPEIRTSTIGSEGVPYDCSDSAEAYAIEIELDNDGETLCIDSSSQGVGFSKFPQKVGTSCSL